MNENIWDATAGNNDVMWVFADKLDGTMDCQFKEARMEKSRSGEEFPVLVFYNAEFREIKVSKWKAEYSHVTKAYGADMRKWVDKPCAIRIKNARPQIIATEEVVA